MREQEEFDHLYNTFVSDYICWYAFTPKGHIGYTPSQERVDQNQNYVSILHLNDYFKNGEKSSSKILNQWSDSGILEGLNLKGVINQMRIWLNGLMRGGYVEYHDGAYHANRNKKCGFICLYLPHFLNLNKKQLTSFFN